MQPKSLTRLERSHSKRSVWAQWHRARGNERGGSGFEHPVDDERSRHGPEDTSPRRYDWGGNALASTAAILLAASAAFADSVFVASIERKDVKITNVRDGAIEFTVAGRAVEPVPLTRVSKIVVTDEPALTAAEAAYDEKKFDLAAQEYQKVLKSSKKPWVKDYVTPRMLLAARQGNKFAAAVAAYVALLPRDPTFAQENRPAVGTESPEDLKSAATALLAASNDSALNAAAKQAVLGLLLDVYRAQNDFASAARVGEQILKSGTLDTSNPGRRSPGGRHAPGARPSRPR